MKGIIQTAIAFVKKDLLTAASYRFDFVVQFASIFAAVAFIHLLGKVVDSASSPFLQSYGGSYFGFLLTGIAFADYMKISINSFANSIRDGQLTGTLEIIFISPTRSFTYLMSSTLWTYLLTTFRIMIYLFTGVFVFGLDIGKANLLAAILIVLISILCYVACGIIYASLVFVVKSGESTLNLMGTILLILGGTLFPPEVLPSQIGKLSSWIPMTYSLHGLRLAILEGYSIGELKGDIVALLTFTILFWMFSIWAFPFAVKRAKIKGTLTQY